MTTAQQEGLGRTARKTLCRKTVDRVELIAHDFVRLSDRLQVKCITEVQEILQRNLNCRKIADILCDLKTQYQMVDKSYSIREEYEEHRTTAQEEFGKAQTTAEKLIVARMFEVLDIVYPGIPDANKDHTLVRAVYNSDKTFEKQIINNEGW